MLTSCWSFPSFFANRCSVFSSRWFSNAIRSIADVRGVSSVNVFLSDFLHISYILPVQDGVLYDVFFFEPYPWLTFFRSDLCCPCPHPPLGEDAQACSNRTSIIRFCSGRLHTSAALYGHFSPCRQHLILLLYTSVSAAIASSSTSVIAGEVSSRAMLIAGSSSSSPVSSNAHTISVPT